MDLELAGALKGVKGEGRGGVWGGLWVIERGGRVFCLLFTGQGRSSSQQGEQAKKKKRPLQVGG